jgi:hypothetical protein
MSSNLSPTTVTSDDEVPYTAPRAPARDFSQAGSWVARFVSALPVLALFTLFITTGLRGVDFGHHWDEQDFHITPARRMIETGVLLPKNYIYPSFDKWLVLLPAIPRGVRAAIDSGGQIAAVQAAMLALFDAGGYLLRARAVFIVVSSLAILWTYGAALALRHRPWEALVAASGLGLSWEFAYHSRWAVTDCILVQFTALTLLMLALFHRTAKPRWIYAASVAAGLATGTKYTGVFVLAAVVLASALSLPCTAYRAQARRAAELCAIAFAVYLCTTPGTLLEPVQFRTDTEWISSYYAHHPHAGHTVHSGWQHAWVVFSYFALAAFSPYQGIAALLFAAVSAGAVLWVARDIRFAAVLVGFPVLFLTVFCVRYRVAIVRNYLLVLPFFALMMARGIGDFARWLPRRELRWALSAGLLGVFAVQAAWEIAAGESIRSFNPDRYVSEALEYVRARADTQFRVSNRVRAIARAQHLDLPPNVVSGRAGTEAVFFGIADGPGSWYFQTNDPWLTKAVFGPREVNFNWYAGWTGNDRLVVMTLEKARATGVSLAR